MARADSTVRVNVVGDARSLQKAAKDSDKAAGKIGSAWKPVAGIIAGAFAIDAVTGFAQSALAETDRVGDATLRLKDQLGDLSGAVIAVSEDFQDLGLSEGDALELSARLADIGEAAGIADSKLAPMVDDVLKAAGALSLITDMDAATVVDLIGKAAGGADKPLKELGVSLSDAEVEARALRDTGKGTAGELTEGELAAARLQIILEKLAPRITEVTGAEADLETRQATLNAKFETFTGNVGEALEGPLTDLLTWLIDMGEAADDGAAALRGVDGVMDDLTGSVGEAADGVRDLLGLLRNLTQFLPFSGGLQFSGALGTSATGGGGNVTVQVQGGSPEVIERAVRDAVRHAGNSGPQP